ncbi:MAG TPA: radical SAM protein [Nitrospirota bacterium]|nr:radical SAM protein [Nitrospirota bacterium]
MSKNIAAIRDPQTYLSLDRYSRAVKDVNRVLAVSAKDIGAIVGLADYQHRLLSPLRIADLIHAADHPEQNPFYHYFSKRLHEILENKSSTRRCEEHAGNYDAQDKVNQKGKHFIGFSLNYLSQALCTFAMIGYIRKEFPGLKIVLGGGLVSTWAKRPGWKNPFDDLIDHLIAGPGEYPLLELLGVQSAKHDHYTPDYESLPIHDYLAPGFILPYSGSSGCYWNKCSFCPETAEDNPYVPVPAESALADLNALIVKHAPVMLHLLDNSVSPVIMRALAENPIGVPWYGFARISQELTDSNFCMQLKQSGCVMLKLGLESGDQGVLDAMQKGIDLETATQVLKSLKKAGIATYLYLLFGTPVETVTEARKTLEFVLQHADAITFLNLAIFNMPVCGKEAGEYKTKQFYEGDLSLYTGFRHPRGWDRKEVRQFLDNEFKRHPVVSLILKKDPPVFTSNHAAFFSPR